MRRVRGRNKQTKERTSRGAHGRIGRNCSASLMLKWEWVFIGMDQCVSGAFLIKERSEVGRMTRSSLGYDITTQNFPPPSRRLVAMTANGPAPRKYCPNLDILSAPAQWPVAERM